MNLGERSGSKIVRGIMSMGASNVLRMGFGFLSVKIATNLVPKEEFGIYGLILTVAYLVEVLGDMGLRIAAAKFIAGASDDVERERIVSNLFTFRLVSIAIVAILALLAKPVLLFFFPSELLAELYIFVPLVFVAQLTEESLAYMMQGFRIYSKMAVVDVFSGALNFALVLLFLIIFGWGVEGYLLSYVGALAVTSILRLWLIPVRKRLAFDMDIIKPVLRFGLPLQGNDILTFTFERVGILILGAVGAEVDATQIAYYNVAAKIPDYFKRFYNAFHSVYFPEMSDLFGLGNKVRAEHLLANFLRLGGFLTLFSALGLTVFGDEAILILSAENYLPSAAALSVLMLSVSVGLTSQMLDNALIAAGHPTYLLLINVVTTVGSLVANVVLIPIFGFMGVAYANLIANLISNPVSIWSLRRENIIPWMSAYFRSGLAYAICLGLYFILGWESFVLRALLVVLFLVLSVAFSVVTLGDIMKFLESLNLWSRKPTLETLEK